MLGLLLATLISLGGLSVTPEAVAIAVAELPEYTVVDGEPTPIIDCAYGQVASGFQRRGHTLEAELLFDITAHFDRADWCDAVLIANAESGWDCKSVSNWTARGAFQHHRRWINDRLAAAGYERDFDTSRQAWRGQWTNTQIYDCGVNTELAANLFYSGGKRWWPTWTPARQLGLP